MIRLWFQNYHSGTGVQNGLEQRKTREGRTAVRSWRTIAWPEPGPLQHGKRKQWSWGTELNRWAEAWMGCGEEGRAKSYSGLVGSEAEMEEVLLTDKGRQGTKRYGEKRTS